MYISLSGRFRWLSVMYNYLSGIKIELSAVRQIDSSLFLTVQFLSSRNVHAGSNASYTGPFTPFFSSLAYAPLMHIGLRISRVVVLIVFTTLVASRMTGCCWRPKKATGSLVIKLYDCRGTPTFCISFVSGMVSGGSWQMISNAGLTC